MSLPGGWEWIIILLFVLIFFGAKRLPEMARGLGKGIREFKNAVGGISDEIQNAGDLKEPSTPPADPPKQPEQGPSQADDSKDA